MNRITITGTLIKDPKIRGKVGENRKCVLNIAVKRDGSSDRDWFNAFIVGTTIVDSIETYLHEKSKVLITGPLLMQKYKKGNNIFYTPEIEIKTIEYLSNYGKDKPNINRSEKDDNNGTVKENGEAQHQNDGGVDKDTLKGIVNNKWQENHRNTQSEEKNNLVIKDYDL